MRKGKGAGTHHTDKTEQRGRGKKGEGKKQPMRRARTLNKNANAHETPNATTNLGPRARGIPTHAYIFTPLTSKEGVVLLVNFVKLHFTAFNSCALFYIATRNKDNEDNKKEPGDAKEQIKTALGRRASGVPSKTSKQGEQVCNGTAAHILILRPLGLFLN